MVIEMLQARATEIIFFIFGAGLLWTLKKFNGKKEDETSFPSLIKLPYEKGTTLLTSTEQKFYHELESIVGNQYTIFTKVRLFDFIAVKSGMDKKDNKTFEDRLKQESIGFLLCTPLNTNPVLAIELENITDTSPSSKEGEAFIDRVFEDIRFPLLRFKVRGSYAVEIKKQLEETIRFKERVVEEVA